MAKDTDNTADIDQQAIALAAINITGPRQTFEEVDEDGDAITVEETEDQWKGRVAENAAAVYMLMHNDRSVVKRRIERLANSKAYPANIVGAKFEKASNRVIVELETKSSGDEDDGIETLRTDRFDEGGRAMATKAREHIGRRVIVYKYMEAASNGSGRQFRILAHLEDIGEAKPFDV